MSLLINIIRCNVHNIWWAENGWTPSFWGWHHWRFQRQFSNKLYAPNNHFFLKFWCKCEEVGGRREAKHIIILKSLASLWCMMGNPSMVVCCLLMLLGGRKGRRENGGCHSLLGLYEGCVGMGMKLGHPILYVDIDTMGRWGMVQFSREMLDKMILLIFTSIITPHAHTSRTKEFGWYSNLCCFKNMH